MRILVTGAAGFIGYHVARRLLAQGHEVIGVDNVNDYYDPNLKWSRLAQLQGESRFQFQRLDLADRQGTAELMQKNRPQRVIHLAAQAGVRYSLTNPHAYVDSNLVAFTNMLEGCRHNGVEHLTYASSSSVYGGNTRMPFSIHQNVDHPLSLYAATKKANELMAHTYSHLYGLPVSGLRFFSVYGPWGRPDMALFIFTKAILNGEPIEVFNEGKMQRDFTYIDDIAEGVVRVSGRVAAPNQAWNGDAPDPGTSKVPYRLYNIGNNKSVELLYLIEVLENCLGRKAEKKFLPMQPGDVPATFADIDDLARDTGFRPSVSIEEGVRRFADWYMDYYKTGKSPDKSHRKTIHPQMTMNTPNSQPSVSIVLPCRNEQGYIQDCVESILKQEPPGGPFEILIADGMSSDGTREYLEEEARLHPQIRVLDNPGRIVSTGLNIAIRAARGDIIVRMDAHTIYAPDYVRQCLAVLKETGADNVGGPMQTTAATLKERAIRAVFHSHFAVGGARSHLVNYEGYVDTVIYGCWKKETFERVGYFDEELVRNQDDEHNFRLTRAGGKIYQSQRIRSQYHVRGSLKALFRQYMQYGYWKVLVIRKHRAPASWRHIVPGAFLGVLCLLAVVGWFWTPALWATVGLAVLYTAATIVAAVDIAAHTQWSLLPFLPPAIACFHFGYGYGFLRGVLDFVVRRTAPETKFVQLTRESAPKPGRAHS